MAIEITGLPQTSVKEGGAQKETNVVQQQGPQGQPATSNSASTDAVTLTEVSVKLQALEKNMSSIPVVDESRVERIKNAIESGEYKVNSTRTAEKFMQLETKLYNQ